MNVAMATPANHGGIAQIATVAIAASQGERN